MSLGLRRDVFEVDRLLLPWTPIIQGNGGGSRLLVLVDRSGLAVFPKVIMRGN